MADSPSSPAMTMTPWFASRSHDGAILPLRRSPSLADIFIVPRTDWAGRTCEPISCTHCPAAVNVAERMSSAWLAFARTGDPSAKELPGQHGGQTAAPRWCSTTNPSGERIPRRGARAAGGHANEGAVRRLSASCG